MNSDLANPFDAFARPPVPALCPDDAGWEVRFLSSPLLQRLEPRAWQRLLRAMQVVEVERGERLIELGAPGDACYVLRNGRVVVHSGRRTLALLEPGCLVGEDALITGGLRSASVTVLDAGKVGRLACEQFERWLLAAVIEPLADPAGRCLLDLDAASARRRACLHLPLTRLRDPGLSLSERTGYCVVGGAWRERCLAAFVLGQRGFDVLPLA